MLTIGPFSRRIGPWTSRPPPPEVPVPASYEADVRQVAERQYRRARHAPPCGQSANPGGRPLGGEPLRALAREHGPEALRRLVELMSSHNEPVAVRACEALLDRAYGKPPQALEVLGAVAHLDLLRWRGRRAVGPWGTGRRTPGRSEGNGGRSLPCRRAMTVDDPRPEADAHRLQPVARSYWIRVSRASRLRGLSHGLSGPHRKISRNHDDGQ